MPSVLEYGELDGYPQFEWEPNTGLVSATRQILVPWADTSDIIESLGQWPNNKYPYGNGFGAIVKGVSGVPWGKIEESTSDEITGYTALYSHTKLTIKYGSPNINDQRPKTGSENDKSKNYSEDFGPFAETLPLDPELFTWKSPFFDVNSREITHAPLKENEAPVRTVKRIAYSLNRFNLTSVPLDFISLVGKINSNIVAPLSVPSLAFAAHSLLYEPANISMVYDKDGTTKFNASFKMLFKEEGWRKYWRGDTQSYDTIRVKATGLDYEFPAEADFSVIFP